MAIVRDLMLGIGMFVITIVMFNLILGSMITDYEAEPISDPDWIEDYDQMTTFIEDSQEMQESALKDVPIVGAVIEVWQKTTSAIRLTGQSFGLFVTSVDSFLVKTLKIPQGLATFLESILIIMFAFIIISALRKYKV
ncbi:MAG: hypothetical protein ACTSPU_00030 [Promethearchaeota archaeon]